ncbi:MAG: virulent strain associated lipoprotein [Parcubacteria group bacterium Licking1014_1]|nr:MAG: virulent strain associated lipoprotein [Parcubacteria group bacterium Licking1014_1]
MTTETEELQTKEFLKRTEIRTMKKDLQKLREADALEEKDKIVKIKTLEEVRQMAEEKEKKSESEGKAGMEKVLFKKDKEEKEAEANLKNYANEAEKQQIFLLESQRFNLESQIRLIEEEKDPDLKLEKNSILLEKRDWEKKLHSILEEEKKLETEQKFISDREKESNVLSEKQSLEKRRWELEEKRQEIEKGRWAIEKKLAEMENKLKKIDEDYEKNIAEKNDLREKIAEIDRTLREVYSKTINRVEGQRIEAEKERTSARGETAEANLQEKENIQREQWRRAPEPKEKEFLKNMSSALKEKLSRKTEDEEKNRKKFMENIEKMADSGKKNG